MTDYCNDDAEACHHGVPNSCDRCDEIGLAHAAGWTQGYEYAFLADYTKLPRWLRWLVSRYVPGLNSTTEAR